MQHRASLIAVATTALVLGAYAATASDAVSGTWNVTLTGAIRSTCTADVQKDGKNLEGNLTCPQVGLRLPIQARIAGNGVMNTTNGDIGWTATLNGDTVAGTYQGALGAGAWTAQRASAE